MVDRYPKVAQLSINAVDYVVGASSVNNLVHCAKNINFGMEVPKTKEKSVIRGPSKIHNPDVTMASNFLMIMLL